MHKMTEYIANVMLKLKSPFSVQPQCSLAIMPLLLPKQEEKTTRHSHTGKDQVTHFGPKIV